MDDFYGHLTAELGLVRALQADLPSGVTAHVRTDGKRQFVFLLNFTAAVQSVDLGGEDYCDAISAAPVGPAADLRPYGWLALSREAGD